MRTEEESSSSSSSGDKEFRIKQLDDEIKEKQYMIKELNLILENQRYLLEPRDPVLRDIVETISEGSTQSIRDKIKILQAKHNRYLQYQVDLESLNLKDENMDEYKNNQIKIDKYKEAIAELQKTIKSRTTVRINELRDMIVQTEKQIAEQERKRLMESNIEKRKDINEHIRTMKANLASMKQSLAEKSNKSTKRTKQEEEEEGSSKYLRSDCMICGEMATRWMEDDHDIRVCDSKLCELKL